MSKEIVIKCPTCKAVNIGKYGFFFNRTITCVKCRRQINPKTDAKEAVTCDKCGNTVVFNTTDASNAVCPVCGESLASHQINEKEVICPTCNMTQRVKFNEVEHVCPICDTKFDVATAIRVEKVKKEEKATVVQVPINNDCVIWRHPQTVFPYASQVIVPEGYNGLILYNGICKQSNEPGNYILSDTVLSQEDHLKAAVHDSSMQVSVEIFYVRKVLNQKVMWTNQAISVTDYNGNPLGTLGVGGSISLRVIDAKKFVEFVGYKTATIKDLLSATSEGFTKLHEAIRSKCFNSSISVLTSAVFNTGIHYKALETNKYIYTSQIESEVNRSLMEIGLKADTFSIDFIKFLESSEVQNGKKEFNDQKENEEKIHVYVERPFEWKSSSIHIHMKNDITRSADVVMGGKIKFYVKDKDLFNNRSEVRNWIKNGVDEYAVSKYCAELVSDGTHTVLSDTFQAMIDDTNVDIRDLSRYYPYLRNNIQSRLSQFFSRYGLEVETFTMEEKERSSSNSLLMMTAAAEHKTEEEIKSDVMAFDNKTKLDREQNSADTMIKRGEINLNTQAKILEQNKFKSSIEIENEANNANTTIALQNIAKDANIAQRNIALEDYNHQVGVARGIQEDDEDYARQQKLKHVGEAKTDYLDQQSWNRDLEQDQKKYVRFNYTDDKAWEHEQSMIEAGYEHVANMTGYQYTSEEASAVHGLNKQGLNQENEINNMKIANAYSQNQGVHAINMQQASQEHEMNNAQILAKIEEEKNLHYLDLQEIEQNALKLRKQWAAESALEEDKLAHQLRMKNTSWKDEMNVTREKQALDSELKYSEKVTEQAINNILIKIAESDLGLQEKRDAYNRLLQNQAFEDELRQTKDRANQKLDITYASAHLRNILTQEENMILDEITEKEWARKQRDISANLARELQREELKDKKDDKEFERGLLLKKLQSEREDKEFDKYLILYKLQSEKEDKSFAQGMEKDSANFVREMQLKEFDARVDQLIRELNADKESKQIAKEILLKKLDIQAEESKYNAGMAKDNANFERTMQLKDFDAKVDYLVRQLEADRESKGIAKEVLFKKLEAEKDNSESLKDLWLKKLALEKDDADFIKDMQRKERETALEMEKLKLEYDQTLKLRELDQALKDKDYELEHLKLVLNSYENMNEYDVRRLGIQEAGKTARANAEYKFRTDYENAKRAEDNKREQERLTREDAYSKRADELLSQMLSIQSAMKMFSLENEAISIAQNADVAKTQINAYADVQKANAIRSYEDLRNYDQLKEELKKIANSMRDLERKVSKGKNKSNGNNNQNVNTNGLGNNMGQFPNMTGFGFMGSTPTNNVGAQPGTKKCKKCGRVLSQFTYMCPYCSEINN